MNEEYEFSFLIFYFNIFIDTDQIWMVLCCSYLVAMVKLSYQQMICE
jgi:hypothetical protein